VRVLLVGCLPPPIGGISSFNRNLLGRLGSAGVEVQVLATNPEVDRRLRRPLFGQLGLFVRVARAWAAGGVLLHVSDATSYKRLILWLLLASLVRKRFLVTFHNLDYSRKTIRMFWPGRRYRLAERLLADALRWLADVIVVNEEMRSILTESFGFTPNSVAVIPAFIHADDRSRLDPGIAARIEGRYVIAASGWVTLVEGADVYGLDQIVELAVRAREHPEIIVVVFLLNTDRVTGAERAYLSELFVRQAGLPNLVFHRSRGSLQPLLMKADIFIRTTLSDGDALSIREAMYYGVRVVASDVVKRPAGVLTYRTGDADDLWEKVRAARKMKTVSAGVQGDFFERIMREYRRLGPGHPAGIRRMRRAGGAAVDGNSI
jgi:glycosyltransferase involved in cell wall biosynthesis